MFPPKSKNKKLVYLDNAAATPVDRQVADIMYRHLKNDYGNPSTLYSVGVAAKKEMEKARKKVADILFTQPDGIIFTGGGTESVNLALLGAAHRHKEKGRHIITTMVEHHAVLNSMKQLEKEGFEVTYLAVDSIGRINLEDFKKNLRRETILVSVMYANNEIGNIFPLADIGREILKHRKTIGSVYPLFHSDACQAGAYLDLNVEKLHVDLFSLNGSKIYGPKGTGVLFKRRGVEIYPIMYGGGQESNLRPGTENVSGVLGFTQALDIVQKNLKKNNKKISDLRDYLWRGINKKINNVFLVGEELKADKRLPNNLNVIFEGVDAESLILYLDHYGIMCSSGSACSTESRGGSHVLGSCALDSQERNSIRFSLGRQTNKADIDYVLKYLAPIVEELRNVEKIK